MSIENWKTDLAPLLHGFKAQKPWRNENPNFESIDYASLPGYINPTFTDQFGNSLCMQWAGSFALIQLLRNPSLITVESDADKGSHYFTTYQHAESYHIVYETRVDLGGMRGFYHSFVVIPDSDVLLQFVENWQAQTKAGSGYI